MNRFPESWLTIKASSEAKKKSTKLSRHGEGKEVPKNQSEDQTSGSLPPTPFVSTKEQIEDPLFLDIDL